MKKQNSLLSGLVPILVVVILVAMVYAGVLAPNQTSQIQQTPDIQENSAPEQEPEEKPMPATFVSGYGFEFSRPDNWNFTEMREIENQTYLAARGPSNQSVSFQRFKTFYSKTLEERTCANFYKGDQDDCEEEYIQVGGVDAIMKTYVATQRANTTARDIGFFRGEEYYHFFMPLPQGKTVQELASERFPIEDIAATFRFIT